MKWIISVAVIAAIAIAVFMFTGRQEERSYLALTNASGRSISVTVRAGASTVESTNLTAGQQRIFSAMGVQQWTIACDAPGMHRHQEFTSAASDQSRGHYFTMSIEGCERVVTNDVH